MKHLRLFENFDEDMIDKNQLEYMTKAKELVDSGKAQSVDDIEMDLGYGIMDKAVLRDTFFKTNENMQYQFTNKINNFPTKRNSY